MFEALLFTQSVSLATVTDAIDIYEGSIPPSATFQVIDVDSTTETTGIDPVGGGDVN